MSRLLRPVAPAGRDRRRIRPGALLFCGVLVFSNLVAIGRSITPAAAVPSQDWPTFLHDVSRSSATTDSSLSIANANLLKLKWAFGSAAPIASSASIVGTTAYVGSWDGFEYAISTVTGALIWKQSLGQTIDPACNPATNGVTSSPAIMNGVLYVGGGDSNWYALDAATGTVLWRVFTGDNSQAGAHYNWSSPLIVNGFGYIGIASNCDNPLVQGQLLKVDLTSHQVVATYNFVPNGQVGGGVWTSPTYDAATNTVYVSTGTLNLYSQTQSQAIVALDATTLQSKGSWQLPFEAAVTDSDWGSTPTLTTDAAGDRLLSVVNKNGIVYTLKRDNLAAGPLWQRRIAIGGDCPTCGDGSIASGVYANNVLYYAGGNNVVNGRGSGGSISALDTATGNVLWTRQTDAPIIGAPAYVNGMLAYGEGSVFQVTNASNGTSLYSYNVGAGVYGAVSVARSQFYVGAIDGKLYAFGIGAAPAQPPADANCPAGFTCQDIRNPRPGSESTSNGVLTVTASGAAIHGTADQYRSITKPVTGDSEASVTIAAQSTQNTQPQAGLMVRQAYGMSTDPGAPFFAVLAYPNDLTEGLPQPDLVIWYRSRFGQNSVELTKWYPAIRPVSVMIQRKGNMFSAGISFDGVNYQLIPGASASVDMPTTTLQGVAVDSGASTNYGTASFTNLKVGGPIVTQMALQPPVDPCPAPWSCQDIGNPNPPGDTTNTGGTLTLAGTGLGIGGTTDSLHYTYKAVSANASISAHVTTQTTASNAQAGLMMRASTAPTAPMYSVYIHPGGTAATVTWRTYDGISSRMKVTIPGVVAPAFLQIVRYQDTNLTPPTTFFGTLTSTDGISWAPVVGSTVPIDMGSGPYLAGLAATTDVARATTPATFGAISISVPGGPPPGICPATFTCSDIGPVALPGNQTVVNNTWTMQSNGSDIWDVFDNFRFAYQQFPQDPANSTNGDGTISARVVSQANVGGPWMKSGVMIRAGADPQAPYYGVFVTPSNGVAVQWRSSHAAPSTSVMLAGATAPRWVLASRYTDTAHGVVLYSAFTSTDGATFAYVPGSTVSLNLPGPLVAGIASDSYDSGRLSTATFDNVAQLPGSQPPPFVCPAAWSCADIGAALPPGQDQLTAGGTWNEIGGGGDIWDATDAFHFVWQTLGADGTSAAHITAQQNTNAWAKAGPMLRATANPGSPYYAAFVTPGNGITVQYRTAQGANTQQLVLPGTAPVHLMVSKYTTGGTSPATLLTTYTSPDGQTWSPLAGSTVTLNSLAGALLAGFGITSHQQGTGSAVTLDSVAVTAQELVPPVACPPSWQCADIGGAEPNGTQILSSGSWTISGGGGDIWNASDAFHYVWQTSANDGKTSAQITSQTPTDPWAKAGVMLRATTDPGSAYYGVFASPANGVVVQWRTAQGASSSQVITAGTVPVYVAVTRTSSTFGAATSTDGVTWTPISGSTQTLPNLSGTLLDGLAVTSHSQGTASNVSAGSVVIP